MPARINAAVFEPLHRPRKRQPAETKTEDENARSEKRPAPVRGKPYGESEDRNSRKKPQGRNSPVLFPVREQDSERKKRRRKQSGTEIEKLPVRSVFGDAEKFFHEIL